MGCICSAIVTPHLPLREQQQRRTAQVVRGDTAEWVRSPHGHEKDTTLSFDGSCDFRHCVTTTLIRHFSRPGVRQPIQAAAQQLIRPPSRTEHRACHLPGFVWCEQNFAAPVMR